MQRSSMTIASEDSRWHAWLNGEFVRADCPSLSVLNRGFLFGDGIFTTMKLQNGTLHSPTRHLQSLKEQCAIVGIEYDIDPGTCADGNGVKEASISDICSLIKRNEALLDPLGTYKVKVIVAAASGMGLSLTNRAPGAVCILLQPAAHPTRSQYHTGKTAERADVKICSTGTISNNLWKQEEISKVVGASSCDTSSYHFPKSCIPYSPVVIGIYNEPYKPLCKAIAQVKSISYMERLALKNLILQSNGTKKLDDMLCVNENFHILESTFSNIFWIVPAWNGIIESKDEAVEGCEYELQSPSKDLPLFFGSTISELFRIAKEKMQFKVQHVTIRCDEIPDNAAVYICNSMREVVPVIQLGNRAFKRNAFIEDWLFQTYYQNIEKVYI